MNKNSQNSFFPGNSGNKTKKPYNQLIIKQLSVTEIVTEMLPRVTALLLLSFLLPLVTGGGNT